MFIGNFDPLQLMFNMMNTLMGKGIISYDEARTIIRNSLPPTMSDEEKAKIIDQMVTRV